MQSVDVLRAEKKRIRAGGFLQRGQGAVSDVRHGIAGTPAPIRVILPHQLRIALPGFNVGKLVMAAPAPVCPLKNRKPLSALMPAPVSTKMLWPFFMRTIAPACC